MGRALGVRGEGFELVPAHELRGEAWRLSLAPHEVVSLLARRLADPVERVKVRALARTYGLGFAYGGDTELLWGLVRAVEAGGLVVVRREAPATRVTGGGGGGAGEPEERGEPEPDARTHWVALQVVDDDSAEPVAGLELAVVLPDGSEQKVTTDGGGRAELRSSEDGSCDVRADPAGAYVGACVTFVGFGRAFKKAAAAVRPGLVPRGRKLRGDGKRALLDAVEHRVRDGETWESVAGLYGVGADALMRFNFDTADPAEIQVAMSQHLGCWRRDPDSGRLQFSDLDEPGVLLVPRAWQRSVTTGYEHILRVRAIRAPVGRYLFSV